MSMRLLTAMACVFALAGCHSSSVAPTAPVNREVTLAQGTTQTVASGLSVQFVAVTGDSRCPGDAICIQGGDAVVKLRVTVDGAASDVELHTGNAKPVTFAGVTLDLVQLMPYPFSSLPPILPGDYRATLRITR